MNSPVNWIGGKSRLYKKIIELMPEHKCYVEPFAGGIWVLINKEKSSVEVINDVNKELINLYEVIKTDYIKMKENFNYIVSSREVFDYYKNMNEKDLDNMSKVDRAIRFLYLNRCSHSGRMETYGYSNVRRSKICVITDDFDETIGKVHKRIKDIYIEHGDYKEMIRRYDKRLKCKETQKVLFYFDPPYDRTYNYKGKGIDYDSFKSNICKMNSDWILSVKDSERMRILFKDYLILSTNVKENIVNNKIECSDRSELIILNYFPNKIPDGLVRLK